MAAYSYSPKSKRLFCVYPCNNIVLLSLTCLFELDIIVLKHTTVEKFKCGFV